jgi:hypothetical protein
MKNGSISTLAKDSHKFDLRTVRGICLAPSAHGKSWTSTEALFAHHLQLGAAEKVHKTNLVARQLYFDGLLDSQSLAKIDLRVLVAPHFKLNRPLDATGRKKW